MRCSFRDFLCISIFSFLSLTTGYDLGSLRQLIYVPCSLRMKLFRLAFMRFSSSWICLFSRFKAAAFLALLTGMPLGCIDSKSLVALRSFFTKPNVLIPMCLTWYFLDAVEEFCFVIQKWCLSTCFTRWSLIVSVLDPLSKWRIWISDRSRSNTSLMLSIPIFSLRS